MILVPLTFHEDQNGYGTQFTIQNHPFINLRQIFSEQTMLAENSKYVENGHPNILHWPTNQLFCPELT